MPYPALSVHVRVYKFDIPGSNNLFDEFFPVHWQVDETHACKKFACQFQSCLKQHGFQNMYMCQTEIDNLRQCCEKYNGISVHCSFADYGIGTDDYSSKNKIKKDLNSEQGNTSRND